LPDGTRNAEAPWQDAPYTIRWRDENGRGRSDWSAPPDDAPPDAAVWPVELRRNEFFRRRGRGDEARGDFASLKELVTDLQESTREEGVRYPVRNVLIRAYQYAIARYDVDGFRIDTLKYIEPRFAQIFGNAVREFALSIGKKNFFTFGEVYDNEERIARFIGRHASEDGDMMGVDAALDFPLFFKLPAVVKGQLAPAEVISLFEHRKAVEREVISSHGEAGRYFVTFLDNHDQTARFHFCPPDAPARFADQLTLGLGLLFALQGIPCVYYGTEQGLHGHGEQDVAVREALWGKSDAFDREHPFYAFLERLSSIRRQQPPMRYGRQYFRPISGDGIHFGKSIFSGGVLAFSRILNEHELLVIANCNSQSGWKGQIIIDLALNPIGAKYELLFTNKTANPSREATVIEKVAGQVEIQEIDGAVTRGPARALPVELLELELQVWRPSSE
jgi:1,4-alpha-glucan branching enzyme